MSVYRHPAPVPSEPPEPTPEFILAARARRRRALIGGGGGVLVSVIGLGAPALYLQRNRTTAAVAAITSARHCLLGSPLHEGESADTRIRQRQLDPSRRSIESRRKRARPAEHDASSTCNTSTVVGSPRTSPSVS